MPVLNYQGSKKNLINFIHEHAAGFSPQGKTLLDIFAGTCSVGYSFKRTSRVYANDSEGYAFIISKALLGSRPGISFPQLWDQISEAFEKNMDKLSSEHQDLAAGERRILSGELPSPGEVTAFYNSVPTVANGNAVPPSGAYDLFLRYYSATYFGLNQAAEIDSFRFAVEQFKDTELFQPLMTALFFAMKECVFAKDGHMAQPLDIEKNFSKLIKQRSKRITPFFKAKLEEFYSDAFVAPPFQNKVFNMDFEKLLRLPDIEKDVDIIYADPPYTDMQYSRYYHLLNFVTEYKPLSLTVTGGKITKGLYTEGRYQSKLSNKSQSLETFVSLIDFSRAFHKNLIISFAYPADTAAQKTDRYVMSIDSLTEACRSRFGTSKVEAVYRDYSHSNNRNSQQKKVREYLIICKGK